MAESFSDNQNAFNCPVCLYVLKDPVTTACGHSFCMGCIEKCWDQEDQKRVYSCPQCRQTFNQRPTLSRSTMLAELIEGMDREHPKARNVSYSVHFASHEDVECDFCSGLKLKAVKSCLVCLASFCETHLQPHYESPAFKRHKLVKASPHLQEQICTQHDKPLEVYCHDDKQCICMLCIMDKHSGHKTVSATAERAEKQKLLKTTQSDFQQKIKESERKVQELNQALESHTRSAQAAVEHSEKIFTELISSIERKRSEVTQMIRAQEKAEEKRVKERIQKLEQEISDLRKRNDELEKFSQIEDNIYFIQNFSSLPGFPQTEDFTVNHLPTFKKVEKTVLKLKTDLNNFCEQEVYRISKKVTAVRVIKKNDRIPDYVPSKPRDSAEFRKMMLHTVEKRFLQSDF